MQKIQKQNYTLTLQTMFKKFASLAMMTDNIVKLNISD